MSAETSQAVRAREQATAQAAAPATDGDFQRGINKAIEKNWIRISKRDRYTYELTDAGATEISEFPFLPSAPPD